MIFWFKYPATFAFDLIFNVGRFEWNSLYDKSESFGFLLFC